MFLTRKVFTPNSQSHPNFYWNKTIKLQTCLKILAAEFKRENYKFILNYCTGFTEMTLYSILVKLMTWNSITSFS